MRIRLAILVWLVPWTCGAGIAGPHADSGSAPPPFVLTDTAPPPEDRSAIQLGGKTENSSPEEWFSLQGNDASGFTGVMITRNVSRASITPFVPDASRASGAAIVVAPGGGTVELSMETQGYRVARWLNERGIAAFVLKYRLVPTPRDARAFVRMLPLLSPPYDGPPVISQQQSREEAQATLRDARDAIQYVRTHASEWGISAQRIGIIGFSAGAYTALNTALHATDDSRPDLVAALYGAMPDGAKVTAGAPPAFIAAATDDPQVPSTLSIRTYTAWRAANVPVELHLFQSGGHGFGIDARGEATDAWIQVFDRWLQLQHFTNR